MHSVLDTRVKQTHYVSRFTKHDARALGHNKRLLCTFCLYFLVKATLSFRNDKQTEKLSVKIIETVFVFQLKLMVYQSEMTVCYGQYILL